jgi:hypothetical protein
MPFGIFLHQWKFQIHIKVQTDVVPRIVVGVALKWSQKIIFLFENLQKSVGPASVLLLEDVDSLLRRPSHLKYQQSTPQHGRKNRQIWRYPASDFECSPLLCCRSLGIYAALVTVAVSFSIGGAHCSSKASNPV